MRRVKSAGKINFLIFLQRLFWLEPFNIYKMGIYKKVLTKKAIKRFGRNTPQRIIHNKKRKRKKKSDSA
jgi:hypothetical protein